MKNLNRGTEFGTNPRNLIGRVFVGTVKEHDPDSKSRVRVYVPEIHGDSEKFPWMTVLRPVLRGAGGSAGWANVPRLDTKVLVIFDGGNINSGVVLGEITVGTTKSGLDVGEDKTWGFQDENSTRFEVNTEDGTLIIHHYGNKLTFDKDGNAKLEVPNDLEVTVGGNMKAEVSGDLSADVSGTTKITSGGQVTIKGSRINLN